MPTSTAPAQVIAVNGGGAARTAHAVALYQRGLAPALWHTAYAKGEPSITLAVVEQGGVAPDDFRFLSSLNTWDDGRQIAAQLRLHNHTSVLIVTDWWHSRRAICALRAHLQGYPIQLAFSPAPAPFGPSTWWRDAATRDHVLRELVAIPYYVLHYGMWPFGCA